MTKFPLSIVWFPILAGAVAALVGRLFTDREHGMIVMLILLIDAMNSVWYPHICKPYWKRRRADKE